MIVETKKTDGFREIESSDEHDMVSAADFSGGNGNVSGNVDVVCENEDIELSVHEAAQELELEEIVML